MKHLTLALAALMMIGSIGCSSAPVAQDEKLGSHADMPATIESTDMTSSDTTSSADPVGGSAPDLSLPASTTESASSSLGASSSGRGH